MMRLSRWQIAVLRLGVFAYILFTAIYCLLAYLPFTYQQVHVGQLLPGVTKLAHLHALLFWPAFAACLLTILPDLKGGPARLLARGFAVGGVAAGVALAVHPLLPNLTNDFSSLAWCVASLLLLPYLALIDWLSSEIPAPIAQPRPNAARMFFACLQTAFFVSLLYFLLAWARSTPGEFLPSQMLWMLLSSLASHLLFFVLLFALFDLVNSIVAIFPADSRDWAETIGSGLTVTSLFAMGLYYVTFPSLSFHGIAAGVVAIVVAVSVLAFVCGLGVRLWDEERNLSPVGLDLLLAPLDLLQISGWTGRISALATIALLSGILSIKFSRLDWEFLVQKLLVMSVGAVVFAVFYVSTKAVKAFGRLPTYGSGVVILASYLSLAAASPGNELKLDLPSDHGSVADKYAGLDVSYRLINETLRPKASLRSSRASDSFYKFLTENTHVPRSIHLPSVDIQLVDHLSQAKRRPHIFFLVIDSLRRDYLSSYNPAVNFTPWLASLAQDSVVFNNAFTHYGGTGLSEPSIWVGGMMLHQQYMTPFGPMNTLQKLMDSNGYQEWVSKDSILQQVIPQSPNVAELDEHIGTMSYDLCRTVEELNSKVSQLPNDAEPIFAYTQAQNVHVSVIAREGRSVPPGANFPSSFDAAYASRVQRVDGCIGQFVSGLKKAGLYDNSIIVVTSDHGDSLGESGRYGHAYTIFPEIVRIPLLVHLPTWMRSEVQCDPEAVTFLTDLAPSLYYLLGEKPVINNALFGRPLFTGSLQEQKAYMRDSYLIASSYAPVYGMLSHNGHSLYIADGVNFREYAYELSPDGSSREVSVADDRREVEQKRIREQVDNIARYYRLR